MFRAILIASVAFAAMIGYAHAACDNHCSGHGTCGFDDVCDCYDNWRMGDQDTGDCSDRVCPFEIAWVDNPDVDGNIHKYAECSGRGICDRSTGECECFEGYTGKGCQRTTCPNDCSGHGTCEYLEDLPFGSVWGDYDSSIDQTSMNDFTYYDWDVKKTRGCLCDPHYTDVDCSRRMCPKSNDVMDERLDLTDTLLYQVQTLSVESFGTLSSSVTFALTFKSKINETFTTTPINFASSNITLSGYVEDALLALPNYVIDGVSVSSTVLGTGSFQLMVTFDGDNVQGPQNLLILENLECGEGCTPRVTGIQILSNSTVVETTAADYNNYECGRRGKCDYDTGLCECFEGYKGPSCNEQTALV